MQPIYTVEKSKQKGGKNRMKKHTENANGMTNAQLNALLETIAKRIENEAQNAAEAARIVREAKAES